MRGCPGECPAGCRHLQALAPEYPQSFPRVSAECSGRLFDTQLEGMLSRCFLRTPCNTLIFEDILSDPPPPGHFRPKGAERLLYLVWVFQPTMTKEGHVSKDAFDKLGASKPSGPELGLAPHFPSLGPQLRSKSHLLTPHVGPVSPLGAHQAASSTMVQALLAQKASIWPKGPGQPRRCGLMGPKWADSPYMWR